LFPLCIYFLVPHERERERLQCAIHSAIIHEADPEQTELAQDGKHLTGAGIKASVYGAPVSFVLHKDFCSAGAGPGCAEGAARAGLAPALESSVLPCPSASPLA